MLNIIRFSNIFNIDHLIYYFSKRKNSVRSKNILYKIRPHPIFHDHPEIWMWYQCGAAHRWKGVGNENWKCLRLRKLNFKGVGKRNWKGVGTEMFYFNFFIYWALFCYCVTSGAKWGWSLLDDTATTTVRPFICQINKDYLYMIITVDRGFGELVFYAFICSRPEPVGCVVFYCTISFWSEDWRGRRGWERGCEEWNCKDTSKWYCIVFGYCIVFDHLCGTSLSMNLWEVLPREKNRIWGERKMRIDLPEGKVEQTAGEVYSIK